ncbi:50S ribosomal protein L25/general stress protein Ctc [Exilibacterium tricleocarpae]|uniref:Large ribosomal subunit protein bL25 n=1 Tax=Exilibacterium tricleocarpae TaxID=2591008 RepID=A0A545U5Q7_9GAMM|nr:50S ribosomal protein L25/general stress protein Ctc [Exilibacterium tricleocarpae]TQV84797.1 50S ribosomal protein L25/general stress protein Ctc [Exilibacterium tricleocarpae]
MSAEDFVLNAEARADAGKGASRRLRRLAEKVPAVVYGGKKKPQSIAVGHNELLKHLENEAFYSHIIELNVDGKSENVILKDLQRHPAKALVMHADFLRVSKTKKFSTRVPLHFINEEKCVGVKMQGGSISRNMTELDINCLPADLPEYIEVDLAEIEAGQIVHISDLTLPKGVESVALSHGAGHDLPVATVNKPRGSVEDGDEESEEEGSAEE